MNYLEFYRQWRPYGCFNIHQIYLWEPNFNRHNLCVWEKKGYIVRLRKGYYSFCECKSIPDFSQYIANRIYSPSYISLQTALGYYGMIPEAVIQVTSVTSLKTMSFKNDFGEYIYKSVKPELMFGYNPKSMADGRTILISDPEKALIDLLYLNAFYETESDMLELRIDEDFLTDEFNVGLFKDYARRIGNKALNNRVQTFIASYGL